MTSPFLGQKAEIKIIIIIIKFSFKCEIKNFLLETHGIIKLLYYKDGQIFNDILHEILLSIRMCLHN